MELFFFLFFRVMQFKSNLYASPMENAAQHKNVKKKQTKNHLHQENLLCEKCRN